MKVKAFARHRVFYCFGRERRIAMATAWRIIMVFGLLPVIGGAFLLLFDLLNLIDDMLGFDFI